MYPKDGVELDWLLVAHDELGSEDDDQVGDESGNDHGRRRERCLAGDP